MKKKLVTLALTATLLVGLSIAGVKITFAWYNTAVQTTTGSFHDMNAKMGTVTRYGYIGPSKERNPFFYSALILKVADGWQTTLSCVAKERIEVSGSDPNGNPLPGNRFNSLSVMASPDGTSTTQEILKVIGDVLFSVIPYGLGDAVKETMSPAGATCAPSSYVAYAEWNVGFLDYPGERGLDFGFGLVVDPSLEGTYTINIHYHGVTNDYWFFSLSGYTVFDLYDTVTYQYLNTPLPPSTPNGPAYGFVGQSYSYSTSTTDPNGDPLLYQFDWGDGSSTTTGWYTSGATASASYSWSSLGTYSVKVRAEDSTGAWSNWSSPSLSVTIMSSGGGGGCPYVAAWNGTSYVLDNNILPDSETNAGHDSQDCYTLQQTPVPKLQAGSFSLYSLKIYEFEHEHDYIDQAQLLAVDHPTGVNVAVSPLGEILTYGQPTAPTSAVSNDGLDVLPMLNLSDGDYYQGYNCSYVTLTFAATDVSAGAKLVIRSEDPWLKCPIYVQVPNSTGEWNTIASFHTRSNWTTDIINMTGYMPDPQGNFKVRLCFVSNDKIDYVGLDTTPQASIQVHTANLLNALSSSQGIVTRLLNADDGKYAELLPGQQILLTFQLPNSQNDQRTFLLHIDGYYQTIP
jgi:hypothetical protein